MKYKKGDWCEFVDNGSLHKRNGVCTYKYLNSICKITSENRSSDPKNYRVVFQDKKGKKRYSIIGEVFLVKTNKAISHSRKMKLSNIKKFEI